MLLDKSLGIALLFSMIFHSVIFLPLAHFKNSSIQDVPPSLKIAYLVPKEASPKKNRLEEKPTPKVTAEAKRKNVVARPSAPKSASRIEKRHESVSQQAKIEIPPELPKEKEGLYLSYYQSIREKIRRFVVENYPRFIARGEVCLYFVLLPNGELKKIKVIEERSSRNRLLKGIAKRSLRQAAPFSAFPKNLNQSQLSFNVIVSFETEN